MQGTPFPRPQRWVLALAAAGSFMAALDALVVTTALPAIQRELGATVETLQWTVNAYNLALSALLMTGAALGDRFGRRRLYIAGLLLFALASAACALAPDARWLVAARAVQGAAAALMMPLALALLGVAVAPAQRAAAMGIFAGLTGLAVLSGPVIGGAVVQGLAWPWIFWVNVPVALLVALGVARQVPESRDVNGALDLPGAFLLAAALLAIVWALVQGNGLGWSSAPVLAALVGGALMAAVFVAWQRQAREPMIPPRLFASPVFAAGLIAALLFTAALMGTVFFFAQYLQIVQGASPLQAGLRLLPWTGTLFVVAPLAGRLAGRVGERGPAVAGLLLHGVGLAWMASLARGGADYLPWVGAMVVAGAGISAAMPAVQSAVLGAVAPHDIGKASGTFNSARQLGGALGVALSVAVFSQAGGLSAAADFNNGFVAALACSASLSFAAAAAAWRLPPRRAVVSSSTSSIQGARQ